MVAFGLTPGVPGSCRSHLVADRAGRPAGLPDQLRPRTADFDNDPDTMDSVARRILRRTDIVEFPAIPAGAGVGNAGDGRCGPTGSPHFDLAAGLRQRDPAGTPASRSARWYRVEPRCDA